jgi:glutamate-1-semialdehyde aminotransferase
MIRASGDRLACVVIEPVVDGPPDPEWLRALRDETRRHGALLVYDEIKTALRVGLGGAAARWGGEPDLIVLGKAIANGFPLAAVGGRVEIMRRVRETWISSTLATEFVSLAAARATIRIARERDLPAHLEHTGSRLMLGFERLAAAFPARIRSARGIPQMCYLQWVSDEVSGQVARECARRGLLLKRNAYNFVSLAHRDADIDVALGILEEVVKELPC